jgi:hypothetical protein
MLNPRFLFLCAWLILFGLTTAQTHAAWMQFAGGPVNALGTWPGGSALSGTATVTASNFINGNINTPSIGLTPVTVGPALSTDYIATTLQPNPGNLVTMIGTPYNDAGDKYRVVIDFAGTTSGSSSGVLPAGSIFAVLDLDIVENYRNIRASDASNVPITTPWIAGPNGYFDMNAPMIPQGSLIPNPTITGPVGGAYQMFGVSYNFDVGMWLFQTTQDVRRIVFDMERATGNNAIGGGGAGWAFYTPPVPEPASFVLVWCGLVVLTSNSVSRHWRH